jgi:hypothetical protein
VLVSVVSILKNWYVLSHVAMNISLLPLLLSNKLIFIRYFIYISNVIPFPGFPSENPLPHPTRSTTHLLPLPVRLGFTTYLRLLYNNKKFTCLSLRYYATVADLPSVILWGQKLQFLALAPLPKNSKGLSKHLSRNCWALASPKSQEEKGTLSEMIIEFITTL